MSLKIDYFPNEIESALAIYNKNKENKKGLFGAFKKDLTEQFVQKTTFVLDQILTQFHAIPLEIKLPFTSTNPLLNRLDQLVEILEEGKDAKFAPLASKVKLLMKSIYSHGPYPIELPSKYDRQDGKIAMVVDDVLTEAECEEWIKEGERTGFVAALVNGQQSNERKSDRCFINSAERASALFQKLKPFFPKEFDSRVLAGVNDRFTMLRYHKGDFFAPHLDGFVTRGEDQKSYFTVMLYFRGHTTGGDTAFLEKFDGERSKMTVVEVTPRTGRILIFEHRIIHESTPLIEGIKYAARADILYQKIETK